MKATLSATLFANQTHDVYVEASFTRGLPSFQIVGLASSAIQESKERVKAALLHNNFTFPPLRITLNLSPSDLAKDGTHFDLPIALSIAMYESKSRLDSWAIFGELGLDGAVKATNQLFALIVGYALQHPHAKIIVPDAIADKIAMIDSLEVYGVKHLQEAIDLIEGRSERTPVQSSDIQAQKRLINTLPFYYQTQFELDFSEVRGQSVAKRAALIAAAGNHNLLLEGSPGSGKSMIAKRLHTIMPPLRFTELLTLAKLESLEGKEPQFHAVRPFRSPHHSSTSASIFGGGSHKARIGEAGLAHLGVLFFDELPHFQKSTLEALREPLEDKMIHISRVNTKLRYDTNFLFVAAMNPCPCGNLLSTTKSCRCSDIEIKRYKNRLSDPLLDRIDLFITMQESRPEDKADYSSKQLRELVFNAFTMQQQRNQNVFNADLSPSEQAQWCQLDASCQTILNEASRRFALSARALDKVVKVARTIADLNGHNDIQNKDLMEAISYRKRD